MSCVESLYIVLHFLFFLFSFFFFKANVWPQPPPFHHRNHLGGSICTASAHGGGGLGSPGLWEPAARCCQPEGGSGVFGSWKRSGSCYNQSQLRPAVSRGAWAYTAYVRARVFVFICLRSRERGGVRGGGERGYQFATHCKSWEEKKRKRKNRKKKKKKKRKLGL